MCLKIFKMLKLSSCLVLYITFSCKICRFMNFRYMNYFKNYFKDLSTAYYDFNFHIILCYEFIMNGTFKKSDHLCQFLFVLNFQANPEVIFCTVNISLDLLSFSKKFIFFSSDILHILKFTYVQVQIL